MLKLDVESWGSISPEAAEALDRVARSWKGTPFRNLTQKRGAGVDCSRLVAAIWDTLYGTKTILPLISPDAAAHDYRKGVAIIRSLKTAFGGHRVRSGGIEPGDAIATRPKFTESAASRPGHVVLALPRPGRVIQAIPGVGRGVLITPMPPPHSIVGVYRPPNKELWK